VRIAQVALLSLAVELLAVAVAAQAPASTKVESQVVATGEPGMRFAVSPRGAHLAVITQKGSRSVVLFDGVPGPLFDQIETEIYFSPDGSRYAYIGRSGSEDVVMVDGKEQHRVPITNETGVASVRGRGGQVITFSPDSKHIAYGIQTVGPGPGGARFQEIHLVYDGVVGPPDGGQGMQVVYSAEGGRHAYLITARAHTALNSGPQDVSLLVVDGKLAPYTAGALQFTADGSHLFSQRTFPPVQGKGGGTEVLLDGKPIMRAQSVRVFMSPVGNGFVAVVRQQSPTGSVTEFLVVGATRIAGSDCIGTGYSDVSFSPDGKHIAAKCQSAAGAYAMVVDGKKGPEYQMITDFTWATDGSRAMYKGRQGMKSFVVTGAEESDGYQVVDTLKFGGGGKRAGFAATTASGSAPWAAVIDGKPVPRSDQQVLGQFGFSPDGSRWAGVAGYGTALTLVVDGADQGAFLLQGFARDWHGARYMFSPDSKHLVAFGQPKAAGGVANSGLFIDGKLLKLGVSYVYRPTFTPDGRHLMFLAEDGSAQRQTLYVDGKAVAQMESNTSLSDAPGAWDLGTDGVLTFLAQDAGGIKRFRVTLGSESSVENVLALAKKL
jgi:hypothetical protein